MYIEECNRVVVLLRNQPIQSVRSSLMEVLGGVRLDDAEREVVEALDETLRACYPYPSGAAVSIALEHVMSKASRVERDANPHLDLVWIKRRAAWLVEEARREVLEMCYGF